MKALRRIRKEAALVTSRMIPITVSKGVSKGMRLFGNLFYNKRSAEPHPEEKLYAKLDLAGKVVIEAGAHIGVYTHFFAKGVGTGTVVAFEPNPQNYYFLRRNIAANRLLNVIAVYAGLSDTIGEEELVAKKFNTERSTFRKEKHSVLRAGRVPLITAVVPMTTIDKAVVDHGLQRVDFVKIDTEGYEPYVVRGMRRVLAEFHPFVYFEIHGLNVEQRHADLVVVHALLDEAGYDVMRLSPGLPVVDGESMGRFEGGAFVARHPDGERGDAALSLWR